MTNFPTTGHLDRSDEHLAQLGDGILKVSPWFSILSYHGSTKRRKELRQGWYNKHHFNVCITSYTLVSRDAHIFKRKMWYYMILDGAHMIKNFRSHRRSGAISCSCFAPFGGYSSKARLAERLDGIVGYLAVFDVLHQLCQPKRIWGVVLECVFSPATLKLVVADVSHYIDPLEKVIEMGMLDDENLKRVSKLHTVLRPYLLRRLKRDAETSTSTSLSTLQAATFLVRCVRVACSHS
ncbi:hypothetical protein EV363DRAFT_639746 [Boletus edulis]|nr:hypothetical protein EV363DRAFT_639746 [Boletus edulis]